MGDYYTLLGVPRLINASGTLTSLGGSRMRPSAARAMADAANCFVDLDQLHRKAGEYVARLLGVEAACITAGAAAGLTQAAAACMVGSDPLWRSRLPGLVPKNEIVIQCCHRNPFERSLKMTGAQLVQVGDAIRTMPFDMEGAINERTAAVVHFLQSDMLEASLQLNNVISIAHHFKIPVIVDAAAELPPKKNLWELVQKGADLVIFSGGKDICGPQASGLMVGRHDLIEAAIVQAAPHEHAIARPMKASKETVVGLISALEEYLGEDEAVRFETWELNFQRLKTQLEKIPGLVIKRYQASQPRIQPAIIPRLELRLEGYPELSMIDLSNKLRNGNPPIIVDTKSEAICLNLHTLDSEELDIVINRFREIIQR